MATGARGIVAVVLCVNGLDGEEVHYRLSKPGFVADLPQSAWAGFAVNSFRELAGRDLNPSKK
jgi:hypothetical protein